MESQTVPCGITFKSVQFPSNVCVYFATGDLDVTMLRTAVSMVGGRIETEASGNVTLATVKRIAETGVKFISSGALTHSVTAMDISLKISLV